MSDLSHKVAWVTGAGSGIGQAAALALVAAGAQIIISGRREDALAETRKKIIQVDSDLADKVVIEALDVASEAHVSATAEQIKQRFGRLDILVNNAGTNADQRHWSNVDIKQWDQVIGVNLNGVIYSITAVLPMMREQQDGLIINVSSWAGRFDSYVAGVAYGATKKAVVSITASVNMEEGMNGIRACALCPGEVATPILDKRPRPPSAEERAKMLQSEDLAETILFLTRLPARACVNELLISPTWNRTYIGDSDMRPPRPKAE